MKEQTYEANTPFQVISPTVGIWCVEACDLLYSLKPDMGIWTNKGPLDQFDNVITNVPAGAYFKLASACVVRQ